MVRCQYIVLTDVKCKWNGIKLEYLKSKWKLSGKMKEKVIDSSTYLNVKKHSSDTIIWLLWRNTLKYYSRNYWRRKKINFFIMTKIQEKEIRKITKQIVEKEVEGWQLVVKK